MIKTAGRAGAKEVLIPSPKQTRKAVISKFKQQMKALRDRFNVVLFCSFFIVLFN